jgi:putative transcriptional regulator
VKAARDSRGWKQKELAAAVHVEPGTVSRWETGRHLPDLDVLMLIAEATGKPLTYFTEVLEESSPYDTGTERGELEERVRAMEETLARLEAAVAALQSR